MVEGAVETSAGAFHSRFVVGADGLHSRIRRWAGLERSPVHWKRFGVRRHFEVAPWCDVVEVYWGPGCEAYVTPVARNEVGVALLWSGEKAGFETLLGKFPSLHERLAGAKPTSKDRGAGPLRQRVRRVQKGRIALVGDAAGYLDAITGEGLAVAFHESKALVQAIEKGDLAHYERAHARLNRLPNAMTGLLLRVERHPWLRHRAIRALAADPALFSRLLGIHARTLPVRDLGWSGALRLARLVFSGV
jgi:flavin-dependent dehydrogenase